VDLTLREEYCVQFCTTLIIVICIDSCMALHSANICNLLIDFEKVCSSYSSYGFFRTDLQTSAEKLMYRVNVVVLEYLTPWPLVHKRTILTE
jgi:hypothetical protein